jgi:hypothetical protein
MGIAIEKKLTEAGYKMLGDDESIELLILNILKTDNIRYLKAIPFLIYKHKADINSIWKKIKSKGDEELFHAIYAITINLFNEFNIKGILPDYDKGEAGKYDKYIRNKDLNYNEFKDEFELQLRTETKPTLFIDKPKIYAERDLQMYLSNLFTKKEKQIIKRLLEEKPISRTDYEYYSRKTKKKLNSIIGLQDFAKALYTKTPKYDQGLYNLKKKLEDWLEKNSKDKEISILEFFLWDDGKISISYKKNSGKYSEDELDNISIKISKIKDKELLSLLNKYKKHNFR